jgi:hypothetical protein
MNVSDLAGQAIAMTTQNTRDAVSLAVLKKTLEIERNSVLTLLDAAVQQGASNPSHLGNSVDTRA